MKKRMWCVKGWKRLEWEWSEQKWKDWSNGKEFDGRKRRKKKKWGWSE